MPDQHAIAAELEHGSTQSRPVLATVYGARLRLLAPCGMTAPVGEDGQTDLHAIAQLQHGDIQLGEVRSAIYGAWLRLLSLWDDVCLGVLLSPGVQVAIPLCSVHSSYYCSQLLCIHSPAQ